MMTDPLADMLTRIRNANRIRRQAVDMPSTRLKANVAQVLKDEGFILDYQVGQMVPDEAGHPTFQQLASTASAPKLVLRVFLKYGLDDEHVIRRMDRASRPGRRLYRRVDQLRPILDGLGISIVSTSRGVMSDRRARTQRLGGELLCTVW
jgi:small subunit ribosomal protein S8